MEGNDRGELWEETKKRTAPQKTSQSTQTFTRRRKDELEETQNNPYRALSRQLTCAEECEESSYVNYFIGSNRFGCETHPITRHTQVT